MSIRIRPSTDFKNETLLFDVLETVEVILTELNIFELRFLN
jgi:hypothetical protein